MPVVQIENGVVVARFLDVASTAEARAKYPHLKSAELATGDHPAGSRRQGGNFTPPAPAPRRPVPESPERRALRILAEGATPDQQARIEAILGPAPEAPGQGGAR